MRTWQEQIPGCFAGMTAPFALHPNDAERAVEMLKTMQERSVIWAEAESAIRDFLTGQNITPGEMSKQMQRVEDKLRPWLD